MMIGDHGTRLFVDRRWDGAHGIGRYAREIIPRLEPGWEPLSLTGSPSSPRDAVRSRRVPSGAITYSPGYNAPLGSTVTIVTLHDLIHLVGSGPKKLAYKAYYRAVIRRAARRAGVVLTVSDTSKAAVTEWLDDDSVDVVNAGIGVSPAFRLADLDVAPAHRRPRALYVGNLRPHKNVPVIFEALARVPDVELRLLLPPSDHEAARLLAYEHDVTSRVVLLPRLTDSELAEEYQRAVATFMPSTIEGFGLPALESISCGTPVIHWGGCESVSEVVGRRGYSVLRHDDAAEWSSLLETAASSGWRVSPHTTDEYSWDRTARVVNATLRSALTTHATTSGD